MEQQIEKKDGAPIRRYGAQALLATGMLLSSILSNESVNAETTVETSAQTSASSKPTWALEWKDDFDGPELSDRWKVLDNTYRTWDRFAQYRQFGVTMRGGKLIVSSRRHCVAPGDKVSMSNDQTEPCPEGTLTEYSSGRVEQVIADIDGDYKVEVVAKIPQYEDARGAVWMNNLNDDEADGSPSDDVNAGYCYQNGPSTPTGESDLVEWYGDDKLRASHHVHCENGAMTQVPRGLRVKSGWAEKLHLFSVERIGYRTTFYVDGEPVPILGTNKKKFTDTPRDFEGVSRSEYLQAYAYPNGMIFDTRVFDGTESISEIFQAPDPAQPFMPAQLKIDSIHVYTARK